MTASDRTDPAPKKILCVDFDGVIHSYKSKWIDEKTIPDLPVDGAIPWLYDATRVFRVVIYSSRSKTKDGIAAMRKWLAMHALYMLGPEHPMATGESDVEFSNEKPAAFLTIDDRAITFHGDFTTLSPEELLKFEPWNKRET